MGGVGSTSRRDEVSMYLVGEGDGDFGLFVGDAFKVEVDEEDGDGWWGFTSPSEIRKLATWIAAKEGLDMRKAHGEEGKDINQTARMNPEDGMNIGGAKHDPRKMDLLGVSRRPTKNELKTLVKNLNEYADFLAWRCGESVDATDDEAEKSAPLKKIGKGKTP